jgi:5'(3')-deoxyribonucleotidase
MRKIIIDIDNTLWDFAPILYEKLNRNDPGFPHHSQWNSWNFWKGLISAETLYHIIRDVHLEQDMYEPYTEARIFLERLQKNGFYIIIASHREKETFPSTSRWLEKYKLSHDEIHLSYDKSVLFEESWAIVDDSPVTLDKAKQAGIVRAGLKNPWNEDEDHPLFATLTDIYEYLRTKCPAKEK